jgi:aldehyde dehydrogenase (NAD+)
MDHSEGILEAIHRVRCAQVLWQETSLKERSKRIARFANAVVEHRKSLAQGILYPSRSSNLETLSAELIPLAETAHWLGINASRILKTRKTSRFSTPMWLGSLDSQIQRVPRGVVLILGTWNYPIFLTGSQMLHALVAGNGVILKPAPGCQEVTSKLAQMCIESGVPEGLVQVIGTSVQDGKSAMELGVDHVVMTGSSQSGRRVLEQSIANLCSSTLELSGSDGVIVLPSADLKRVTKLLRFGLRLNGGATCIAPRRILVHESMVGSFTKLLQQELSQPPGEPWRTSITWASYVQLKPLVQAALSQGARLLLEWQCDPQIVKTLDYPQPQTRWIPSGPVVLENVTPQMGIYGLDIFAPLMTIVPVRDIEQAIEYDALCKYGLCVSIFGEHNQAAEVASGIRAGSVILNDLIVPTADPRLPFGGRGESGFGVTRGEEGLLEMTIPRVISSRRGKWLPHSDLPQRRDEQLLDSLLQFGHSTRWSQRFRGLRGLIASIRTKPNQKNEQ